MNISITDFKDILLSKSGGKPISKLSNFYSLLFQAMNKVKKNVDLPSAIRTTQLTNPIYSDITEYPLPTDIGLNAIIYLRPINPDNSYYDFTNLNTRQLLIEQKYNKTKRYTVRYKNGVPYLVIDEETTAPTLINACDSTTANGVAGVVGASTNVEVDTLQQFSGSGALSFTVGVGSSNGIDITGFTAVDLSSQKDILAYVYLPSITNVTGVKISLGQSIAAYNQASTNQDFFGAALKVGWNLIRIPKASFAVGAGSPTWGNVNFLRYEIVGTIVTPVSGFKLDSVVGQIGALYEIDYYSENNFVTAAGVYINKPTTDTDSIALTTADEQDLFTDQFIEIMAVDLKQQGATVDYQAYGGNNLKASYEMFKFKYPSQRQLVTTKYGSRPNIN